jgi:membrane fusion protein, heavy metal efflux system
MIGRVSLLILALAAGFLAASVFPQWPQRIRAAVGFTSTSTPTSQEATSAERKPGRKASDDRQGLVKLSEDEIKSADIEFAAAQAGIIAHRIVVPGTIVPQSDRIARVSVRLFATVSELRKKLGDIVAKDEVVAVLDSREVANAKSEYLAARLTSELSKDLYDRDKELWDRHIIADQIMLRSRNAVAQARVNLDIARQKLFAIGLTEKEIAALPQQPEASLRLQQIQSPISGHVVDRKVDLGAAVGRDNLETELFTIADLDRVWVELAVGSGDLPLVREGQSVSITTRSVAEKAEGIVVFISPMLDKETRSARVVAEIKNESGIWRPGSFVTAAIAFEEKSVPLAVPSGAIQNMGTGQVAFVRTAEGFTKRQVALGPSDDRVVEVLSGLHPGEVIAVTNTFLLKAELLKALAED